jgi:AraC family transcriptional regulator of arabinose operon
MYNSLNILFQNANMNIIEFDINSRKEMKTFGRSIPYYIMSYHKKGEAKLRIGDEVYCISPGTAILIPPNVEHDHYKISEEDTTFFWCHFTYDIGNVIDILKIFNLPVTFQINDITYFEKVFFDYKNLMSNIGLLSSAILRKAKAYEILHLFLESAFISSNSNEKEYTEGFLCMLCEIIQQPEQDFSLSSLSEKYHLHPTYISNRFKELFGLSPIQVQRELRISKAKTLLKTSEMSVGQIAEAVGFNGLPNFIKSFKSYVGITPTQFRNLDERWENVR